ncbi:MAG TPA: tryptophan synthase subunit alpha [Verrucomicrobiae bacterium]|nr:tryptophan synthase subunit alpha [Verrucomicrobiae bacterium]
MIEAVFERAKRAGRAALIPYVMAGDPSLQTTALVLRALTDAGADLIELGVPYGDPLADGPTIAAAGQRALGAGTALPDVLALVREAAAGGCAPIVLFSYFNPVYRFGIERFARELAAVGAAGAIVPDVALEETGELRAALASAGVAMPLLVAPSTPPERAARIAAAASGFVYVVSRLGVTGAGAAPAFGPVRAQLAALRALTGKPLAVGFGVSRSEHVREIAGAADGVIVGSALIDAYAGLDGAAAAAAAGSFAQALMNGPS